MDKRSVTSAASPRIQRVELAEGCWLHVAVDGDGDVVGTVAVDASDADVARISWLVVDGSRVDGDGVSVALIDAAAQAAAAAGRTQLEARPHWRWATLGFARSPDGKVVKRLP
jgi:hypothetical protein